MDEVIARSPTRRVTEDVVEQMLGVSRESLPAVCRDLIHRSSLEYEPLDGTARDEVLVRILDTLDRDLPASAASRLRDWEAGWDENFRNFAASGWNLDELTPMYYRHGNLIFRLLGEWVRASRAEFEIEILAIIRAWMGATYFARCERVYEFGCGPGHNLAALADMFPETRFVGFDWARSSQRILDAMRAQRGLEVEGRWLDMFAPCGDLHGEHRAGVFTFGALEQLGTNFEPFLNYLLAARPAICVHFEPIYECYAQDVLFDRTAALYHRKRGYLVGFLPKLQTLESDGVLRIERVRRVFGGPYHDGWTNVVWKPVATACV
jgi:hypothetical protein